MKDDPKVKARYAKILHGFISIICSTLRVKKVGWERYEGKDQKLIMCGWHGKSFIFAHHFRNRGYYVIISSSNDGDIQNGIFERFGYRSIRGSTGKGGVRAALSAVKVLREGATLAMTPDGPRGPSKVVQGGVMMMAQKSGAGLVPVGIKCKPAIYMKSWDRYMLPLMFGRAELIFGEPIFVPENATEEEVEQIRLHLESEITRLDS